MSDKQAWDLAKDFSQSLTRSRIWTPMIKPSYVSDTAHGPDPLIEASAGPSLRSAGTFAVVPRRGLGHPASAATCMPRVAAVFMAGYRPARSRDPGRNDPSRRSSRSHITRWRTLSSGRSCAVRGFRFTTSAARVFAIGKPHERLRKVEVQSLGYPLGFIRAGSHNDVSLPHLGPGRPVREDTTGNQGGEFQGAFRQWMRQGKEDE